MWQRFLLSIEMPMLVPPPRLSVSQLLVDHVSKIRREKARVQNWTRNEKLQRFEIKFFVGVKQREYPTVITFVETD